MPDNTVVEIQYPVLDHTESVANISLKTFDIKGHVTIKNVLLTADNSLFLMIINNGEEGFVKFIAGDAYPNSMLGDVIIEIPSGISAINLADMPRFIKQDESVDLEFSPGFKGKVFAMGKWNKVRPQKVDW